jgi:hypothetical protein
MRIMRVTAMEDCIVLYQSRDVLLECKFGKNYSFDMYRFE